MGSAGRREGKTTVALGRGGPFLTLLRQAHLLRGDEHNVLRPYLATIALTWLPLAVLAPFSRGPTSLFTDFSVHARLLVSIPLLFEADLLLHDLSAATLGRFAEATLTEGLDSRSIEYVEQRAEQLRSSAFAELVCLLVALLVGQVSLWGKGVNPFTVQGLATLSISPATLWYGCVSLPAFTFLLYRALWRWEIWCWIIWRFSRMELRLVPTHPDLSGGLSLFAIPVRGFALFLLAISVGVSAAWGTQIVRGGASIRSFAAPVAMLVAVALLVGLGPLLAFSGKLLRAKVMGRAQYGVLASAYTTQFDERWIVRAERAGLLGTSDIQSLADLANSYALVRKMRFVPFDKYDVMLIIAALLLPLAPLILTEVPLQALLLTLAKALL